MNQENSIKRSLFAVVAMMGFGVAVAATVFAADGPDAAKGGKAQWEYLQMNVAAGESNQKLGRKILKLGREGWELVTVITTSNSGTTTEKLFYFKRQL